MKRLAVAEAFNEQNDVALQSFRRDLQIADSVKVEQAVLQPAIDKLRESLADEHSDDDAPRSARQRAGQHSHLSTKLPCVTVSIAQKKPGGNFDPAA